jgi:glutamine synthetase
MPTKKDVIEACEKDGIESVRILFVDNAGIPRGRVVPSDEVADVMENGETFPSILMSFNALDKPVPGGVFGVSGEFTLRPDPETFRQVPYADDVAIMLCDIDGLNDQSFEADPRSRLRQFIAQSKYTPVASFESEFYLLNRAEDGELVFHDNTPAFAADGMQDTSEIVPEMMDALRGQGIHPEMYYPEYGPGQQELVIEPASGVESADMQVLKKQTIKAVASNNGQYATFAPVPAPGVPGSGCHLNISLWQDGENLFYGEDGVTDLGEGYAVSDLSRYFIGGLLEHGRALSALTAPTTLSYKRLVPNNIASAFTAWGPDNRECMVRVPSVTSPNGGRIEFKWSDNTSNPYLALLGILAAGIDGIERKLDPGEAIDYNPATLSDSERSDMGIEPVPMDLGEAVDDLEECGVLREAMGKKLFESYIEVKRSQFEALEESATADEATEEETEHFIQTF